VSGRRRYRVTGQRGTVTYLAFCVYAGNMARGEPTRVTNIADTDLTFDAEGRFTLTLAPAGAAGDDVGDVIALDPGAHTVIARQYHLDRAAEVPATYRIEVLDEVEPEPHLDGERLAKLARRAAAFLTAAVDLAVSRTAAAQERPNTFVAHEGHGVFGTPDAHYLVCWYDLAEDEAMVIEGRPPECRYWGVHLANRWASRSTIAAGRWWGTPHLWRSRRTAPSASWWRRPIPACPTGSTPAVIPAASPSSGGCSQTPPPQRRPPRSSAAESWRSYPRFPGAVASGLA